VKYSYITIQTPEQVKLIAPYLLDEIRAAEHVIPSYSIVPDRYSYITVSQCVNAVKTITDDTIYDGYPIKEYMNYIQRVYISARLVSSEYKFHLKIKELKELAEYIKVNGNEV
jgi:hypothetical protein